MNKRCYRFFGGLLATQERWLNSMAHKGYRLVQTDRMAYEFASCQPRQYEYRVEFVANQSRESAEDYARFLRECGYRVFFKNINLRYGIGKVQIRPWAERGGRIATSATTLDRELLIVEKEADGKPFELHTTYEDRRKYCLRMMMPWLFLLPVAGVAGAITQNVAWWIFAGVALVGIGIFALEMHKLKKQAATREW